MNELPEGCGLINIDDAFICCCRFPRGTGILEAVQVQGPQTHSTAMKEHPDVWTSNDICLCACARMTGEHADRQVSMHI